MTRALTVSLLLSSLLLGCGDGPAQPDTTVLRTYQGGVPIEETTIEVGRTLQLSGSVERLSGEEVAGRTVAWKSTAPEVAVVDATGLVTGVAEGTALVVASSGTLADTVRVNVARPVTSPVACVAGQQGLSLAVGQVHAVTADQAVTLCIQGGTAASEYTLIPFNASGVADARLRLDISSAGAAIAAGPPTPDLSPAGAAPAGRLVHDDEFHLRLRERTAGLLTPQRLRTAAGPRPSLSRAAAVPRVGDRMQINVESVSDDGCATPDYRSGRVVAVTQRAVVVADEANPANGFTEEDYRSFGVSFDTLVWKVVTSTFGEPADVDGNGGRAVLFFTRAVNELTPIGSSSFVGGFFYNRDLYPRTGDRACTGSNLAEMFYLMVPDPTGSATGNARSVNFVRNNTVGVLAHEFQHLVNDSRRLFVNRAPVWEETWLNEGLSHIAEELLFYHVSGLSPRLNLDPAQLRVPRVRDAFESYAVDNIDRLVTYLQAPEANSLMGADELPTRGAAWSFLRYAADRRAGNDQDFWRTLVNSRSSGLDNLAEVLPGENARDWMRDWSVALYTDDAATSATTVLPVEPRYTMPSWNLRTTIPALRELVFGTFFTRYPLSTRRLVATMPALILQGGGAAYVRFGVPAGQQVAIRTTVGGLPAPSRVRLALVRTR